MILLYHVVSIPPTCISVYTWFCAESPFIAFLTVASVVGHTDTKFTRSCANNCITKQWVLPAETLPTYVVLL